MKEILWKIYRKFSKRKDPYVHLATQGMLFCHDYYVNSDLNFNDVESILDIGCGFGFAAHMHTRYCKNLKLITLSDKDNYKTRYGKEFLNFFYKDLKIEISDKTDNASHDLLFCSNVIEHVDNLEDFFKILLNTNCKRIVILCPAEEKDQNGKFLNGENVPPSGHLRSIKESDFLFFKKDFKYSLKKKFMPGAWIYGEQFIFEGIRKKFAQ